jgi:hypothetical protein
LDKDIKLTNAPNAAAIAEDPKRKNMSEKDVLIGSVSVGMSYMHPDTALPIQLLTISY